MYSMLAPHMGQTTFSGYDIGTSELRGGKINWGALGSSISNAFKTTGRFIGSAANKFAKSKAFADIKQGLNDSGIARNVAALAGETLNNLVDIGRTRLQQDLDDLREKALKKEALSPDKMIELLMRYQDSVSPAPLPALPSPSPQIVELESEPPLPAVSVPALPSTSKRPLEVEEMQVQSFVPSRKRFRGTGVNSAWRQKLNEIVGSGVNYSTLSRCY
ncbi:pVI [Frog adenovirus 1]|uniref:PVI n=1 Tax=Frog adenovirus 1 (strain ATCC VR-896) TaxID=114102 RepID=Q9IIH6_ADEF1|nr:pVI [Frog adenovirus 1]AAF86931.1 pVI [Frog adenovirus 1]